MSFFEELKTEVGVTDLQLLSGFSYVNFCGETLYLEGVKRLERISDDCVVVRTKYAVIEVCGCLKVETVVQGAIVISGRIDCVTTRRLR